MIDQLTIDRIFEAAEIVDVVSEFVSLKRRGTNYLGNCPFHNERTPSFMVSPAKGIFKCFGCGKGGNSVNFVMEHEQLSYPEALRFLARKYHIQVAEKEESPEDIQQKNERESLLIVSDYAKGYFQQTLLQHPEGRSVGLSYFRERGFSEQTIATFELGYSLEKRDALCLAAQQAGYKMEYLVASGLAIERENYRADRFWGRVIFPIHNISGRVIAFGARILRTDKNTAKYLNSPESPIYHKGNVLYGIFQAKRAIVQQDKCFLVEGYTDVLAMHQAGIHNVVASSGTALTENQIRLIKRFTTKLTILYDGDAAGIKASLRGIDLVLQQDIDVKVLLLPDGDDPDSFSRKHSAEELLEFVARNETDFIRFKAKLLLKDAKDPVERAAAINDIVRSIAKIGDEIKRQVFIKETYQLLDIDERRLTFQVSNLLSVEQQQQEKRERTANGPAPTLHIQPTPAKTEPELSRMQRVEHQLLHLLLKHANDHYPVAPGEDPLSIGEYIVYELEDDQITFSDPLCRRIFETIQAKAGNGELPTFEFFLRSPELDVQNLVASILSQEHQLSEYWAKKTAFMSDNYHDLRRGTRQIVVEYKKLWVESQLDSLQQQLRYASPDDLGVLLPKIQQMQRIRSILADELSGRIVG